MSKYMYEHTKMLPYLLMPRFLLGCPISNTAKMLYIRLLGKDRWDSKRRVLRPSESIRAGGKYQYKYHIDGKPHFVYSWKLEPTDKLPPGKKPCLSLR